MLPSERTTLLKALDTLDGIRHDLHNYNKDSKHSHNFTSLGSWLAARRMLAELLNLDINDYLLPGECNIDYLEDDVDEYRVFTAPSDNTSPLSEKEKKFVLGTILPAIDNIMGLYDSDDACVRCLRRMLGEVVDRENLEKYRLLGEGRKKKEELSLLYYKPEPE